MSDISVRSLPQAAPRPQVRSLEWAMIFRVLRKGLADFCAAPLLGLFFAAVFVAGGWALYGFLIVTDQIWWALPVTLGFPLLGPFVAVGFYEMSRRLSKGEAIEARAVLLVIGAQGNRQLPVMAWVVLIFFLFWNFLAHMIFALFMGLEVMTNVSSSLAVFVTPAGLTMLAVGTGVGAILSGLLFAITVISLPLLLDKELDFVTAMIVSVEVCRRNRAIMGAWAICVAALLAIGMVPGLLGLFVVLPILGHASWHLYTEALQHPEG